MGGLPAATAFQDRLFIVPAEFPQADPVEKSGRITDIRGLKLSFRQDGAGLPLVYSLSRVAGWQPGPGTFSVGLRTAWGQGDWARVVRETDRSLNLENRDWVRRELMALKVAAEGRLGRASEATATFRLILREDPETRLGFRLPFPWAPLGEVERSDSSAAVRLSDNEAEWFRLLAVAGRAGGSEDSGAVMEQLETLRRSSNRALREVAEIQRWRHSIGNSSPPRPDQAEFRDRRISEMLPEVRGYGAAVNAVTWQLLNQTDRSDRRLAACCGRPALRCGVALSSDAASRSGVKRVRATGTSGVSAQGSAETVSAAQQLNPPGLESVGC